MSEPGKPDEVIYPVHVLSMELKRRSLVYSLEHLAQIAEVYDSEDPDDLTSLRCCDALFRPLRLKIEYAYALKQARLEDGEPDFELAERVHEFALVLRGAAEHADWWDRDWHDFALSAKRPPLAFSRTLLPVFVVPPLIFIAGFSIMVSLEGMFPGMQSDKNDGPLMLAVVVPLALAIWYGATALQKALAGPRPTSDEQQV